jgi:hypothetical protein
VTDFCAADQSVGQPAAVGQLYRHSQLQLGDHIEQGGIARGTIAKFFEALNCFGQLRRVRACCAFLLRVGQPGDHLPGNHRAEQPCMLVITKPIEQPRGERSCSIPLLRRRATVDDIAQLATERAHAGGVERCGVVDQCSEVIDERGRAPSVAIVSRLQRLVQGPQGVGKQLTRDRVAQTVAVNVIAHDSVDRLLPHQIAPQRRVWPRDLQPPQRFPPEEIGAIHQPHRFGTNCHLIIAQQADQRSK